MNEFKVLIIDDSVDVIQALDHRVSTIHTVAGASWLVKVQRVHVKVIVQEGKASFDSATFQQLEEAVECSPNLILLDYGFPSPEQQAQKLDPADYVKKVLCAPDLFNCFEEHLRKVNSKEAAVRAKRLFTTKARIYLYTYTPEGFEEIFPNVPDRAKNVQRFFRNTTIQPIDTAEVLYDRKKFSSKHDRSFYSYLVTWMLDNIIARELREFALESQGEKLRYVRYRRSGLGVFVVVLIAGSLGAFGQFLGGAIVDLAKAGQTWTALAFGLTGGLVAFVFGLIVPLIFERMMSNLLRRLRDEELE